MIAVHAQPPPFSPFPIFFPGSYSPAATRLLACIRVSLRRFVVVCHPRSTLMYTMDCVSRPIVLSQPSRSPATTVLFAMGFDLGSDSVIPMLRYFTAT